MFNNNFKNQKIRVISKDDTGQIWEQITKIQDFNAKNIIGEILTMDPYAGQTKSCVDCYVCDVVTAVHKGFTVLPIEYRNQNDNTECAVVDINGYALNTVKYAGSGNLFKNLGRLKYEFSNDVGDNDLRNFISYYFEFIAKFLNGPEFRSGQYKTMMHSNAKEIKEISVERQDGYKISITDISYDWVESRKMYQINYRLTTRFSHGHINSNIKKEMLIDTSKRKYASCINMINKLLEEM